MIKIKKLNLYKYIEYIKFYSNFKIKLYYY